MNRPSAEASIHANRSCTRAASAAVGIHVERAAVPGHTLGLDLELLRVAMTMAADRDRGAKRNDSFLESRALGARRRREDDVPHLSLRANTHGGVRSSQADRSFQRAGELE